MRLDDRQLAFYRTFGFLRFPALFADPRGNCIGMAASKIPD